MSNLLLIEELSFDLKMKRVDNEGTGKLGKTIPKFRFLKSLKLNLSNNSIDDEGIEGLVNGFSKCTKLQ